MALEFETENVHLIYTKIAEHFSNTRFTIWDRVHEFIDSFQPNSKILDIGCGNGKNMGSRDDCIYVGLDICNNLINQAQSKNNCSYITSDCLNIPLKKESFNYIMSIAVIHHLSNLDRRIKSLLEIKRLLKKGGQALIYVWSYEQPKFKNELSQDVMVKWTLNKKYNDNEKDKIYHRYYHLFKKNELEMLISQIDSLKIIESGQQCYNWYCIIEKV